MSTHESPSSVTWPIAAAMLPFANSQEAEPEVWLSQLAQVANEGFSEVDLTDNWLRIGDLSVERLRELAHVLQTVSLAPIAVSAIRRSVIDPELGEANLA